MQRAAIAALAAVIVLCTAAYADTPPAASAATAPAPQAAAATPPAEPSEAKASPADSAVASQRAALLKQARAQGYRERQQGGKTVYCKSEALLGSRLAQTRCVTEDVLFNMERERQATQDEMSRRSSICGGTACGGSG